MTETNRTHCSLTENETSLKIIVLFQHACMVNLRDVETETEKITCAQTC